MRVKVFSLIKFFHREIVLFLAILLVMSLAACGNSGSANAGAAATAPASTATQAKAKTFLDWAISDSAMEGIYNEKENN